jgi:hypothetical protein
MRFAVFTFALYKTLIMNTSLKKNPLCSTLNWDVLTETLSSNSLQPTGKIALIRSDNRMLLGIHGRNYRCITNKELMQLCCHLEETGVFRNIQFQQFRKGKAILAYLEFTGLESKEAPANVSEDIAARYHLILGTSFDGSRPFYAGVSQTLIRCENQFYATKKLFREKHSNALPDMQQLSYTLLSSFYTYKNELIEDMQHFKQVPVNDTLIKKIIHDLLHLNPAVPPDRLAIYAAYLLQSIDREIKALGPNAFGLFNGITWFTSHHLRPNDPFSNTQGLDLAMNNYAWNTLKQWCLEYQTQNESADTI